VSCQDSSTAITAGGEHGGSEAVTAAAPRIIALQAIWRPMSPPFQSDMTSAAALHTHTKTAVTGGVFALLRK
jgi:hypothetical protein